MPAGGINAVHEALLQAVPLCVLPLLGEQPYQAQRVLETGAGLVIDPVQLSTVNPDLVQQTMHRLLTEPSFQVRLPCWLSAADCQHAMRPVPVAGECQQDADAPADCQATRGNRCRHSGEGVCMWLCSSWLYDATPVLRLLMMFRCWPQTEHATCTQGNTA